MKKVIGWILIVCGIFSLPGFLTNLGHAHDGYEVIGMFIGQGLIYFLAYLCLRNKTSEPDSSVDNNITVRNDVKKVEQTKLFVKEFFNFLRLRACFIINVKSRGCIV